jgi:hypothetical protein
MPMAKSQDARLHLGTLVVGIASLLGVPLLAHHSDAAFHTDRLITLQGTVITFLWENPHIRVDVAVKDADGTPVTWMVEGNPPGRIRGRGLKDALKIGDRARITAYPPKDPSRRVARGYALTLPDGRRFIIGSERN